MHSQWLWPSRLGGREGAPQSSGALAKPAHHQAPDTMTCLGGSQSKQTTVHRYDRGRTDPAAHGVGKHGGAASFRDGHVIQCVKLKHAPLPYFVKFVKLSHCSALVTGASYCSRLPSYSATRKGGSTEASWLVKPAPAEVRGR